LYKFFTWYFNDLSWLVLYIKKWAYQYLGWRLHWMMSIYIWCAMTMWLAPLPEILEYCASVSFIGKPGNCKSLRTVEDIWTNDSRFTWWYWDYRRPQLVIIAIWGCSWCFHQFYLRQSTLWVQYHLKMGASVVPYHILVSTHVLIFGPNLLWLVVLYWRPFYLLLIELSCSSKVVVSLQAYGWTISILIHFSFSIISFLT
jgi:hypothetical protein